MLARHGRTNNGQELSLQPTARRRRRHLTPSSCRNDNNTFQGSRFGHFPLVLQRQLRRELPQHSEPTAASSAVSRDALISLQVVTSPASFSTKTNGEVWLTFKPLDVRRQTTDTGQLPTFSGRPDHPLKPTTEANDRTSNSARSGDASTSESSRYGLFSLVFTRPMTESFSMTTGSSSNHPASAIKLDVTLLNNSGDRRDSRHWREAGGCSDDAASYGRL